jgi:Domain of unknown function (DUF4157)
MSLAQIRKSTPGRNSGRTPTIPTRRSLGQNASIAPVIQARLRIGAPGDAHEQEANRVGRAVVSAPGPGGTHRSGLADIPRTLSGETPGVSVGAGKDFENLWGHGQPLAQPLRGFFESRFGHDFGRVRIHAGAQAAGLAESMQARAFAIGRDVVFGAGEFAPDTSRGRELMAHEITHVVQQEGGAGQSQPATIQRQPKTDTAPPVFPDFPNLALKLEDDIGQNLFDYGHHFYRLATLFPDQPELLQQAFGRYALGKNVLDTGFRFLGLDERTASRLSLGTGILFKGLNFVKDGEIVLDFQFDIARGLKLETSLDLGVNPEDRKQVQKAEAGISLVGHF